MVGVVEGLGGGGDLGVTVRVIRSTKGIYRSMQIKFTWTTST